MSQKLVEMLLRRYGQPRVHDFEFFMSGLKKLTKSYGDELADRAFEIIVNDAEYNSFPVERVILKALQKARSEVYSAPSQSAILEDDEWSRNAIRFADKAIQSEMGRKAADAGWIGVLWDHLRKARRKPTEHEINCMVASATETDCAIENLADVPRQGFGKLSHTFAAGIKARREQLKRIAYGEAN